MLRKITIALLVCMAAANTWRAARQAIVADEAFSYNLLIAGAPETLFNTYDACHHFLYTYLATASTALFGNHPFTLRLPALLAGFAYLYVCWRLAMRAFGDSWIGCAVALWLGLHPFLGDHQSMARGYGLAVTLMLFAIDQFLSFLEDGRVARLRRTGWILGFGIGANLTVLPAAAGLGLAALFVAVRRLGLGKGIYAAAEQVAAPALVVPFFLGIMPLAHATREHYYYGEKTVLASIDTLLEATYLYSRPQWLQGAALDFYEGILRQLPPVIPIALAMAALVLVLVKAPNAVRARQLGLTALLMLAFSACFLVAGNRFAGLVYPRFRTGLYLIPLAAIVGYCACAVAASRGGALRWVGLGMAGFLAVDVLVFVATQRPGTYNEFVYDSGSRRVVNVLAANRPRGAFQVRVGGSGINLFALEYYRRQRNLSWLAPQQRDSMVPGLEFYVCLPQDEHLVRDYKLNVLYRDPVSEVVLAASGGAH